MFERCYMCKKWDSDDGMCALTNTHKGADDSCSSFDSIPCCQVCSHWERDFDDYSKGYCSVLNGMSPYDSICRGDHFSSKTIFSSKSSSTPSSHATSNSAGNSGGSSTASSSSSSSGTSDTDGCGKGCLITVIVIILIIGIIAFAVNYFDSKNSEHDNNEKTQITETAAHSEISEATEAPEYPAPERNLQPGMSGDDVRWLQSALSKLGYPVDIDGEYGDKTAEAVKRFQEANGLEADGLAGPVTQETLISLLG